MPGIPNLTAEQRKACSDRAKARGLGGRAPDRFRCTFVYADGNRCGRWAVKGYHKCWKHGGAVWTRHQKNSLVMGRKLFYSKRLGPKLKAAIEEALAQPESDRISLEEELELVRHIAGDAIQLYSNSVELPDGPNKDKALGLATQIGFAALEQVRVYCKTAAEVKAAGKDQFSIHALQDVANQITRLVAICFDDYPEAMAKFDRLMSTQLRLPIIGPQGTRLTPDKDAIVMDDSIPSAPPEWENNLHNVSVEDTGNMEQINE